MLQENTFASDIDNTTRARNVNSFLIGPVFAQTEKIGRDYLDNDRSKPIAILQLINKKDLKKVDEYDVKKFESL